MQSAIVFWCVAVAALVQSAAIAYLLIRRERRDRKFEQLIDGNIKLMSVLIDAKLDSRVTDALRTIISNGDLQRLLDNQRTLIEQRGRVEPL